LDESRDFQREQDFEVFQIGLNEALQRDNCSDCVFNCVRIGNLFGFNT
jgi:hypothetical protein